MTGTTILAEALRSKQIWLIYKLTHSISKIVKADKYCMGFTSQWCKESPVSHPAGTSYEISASSRYLYPFSGMTLINRQISGAMVSFYYRHKSLTLVTFSQIALLT